MDFLPEKSRKPQRGDHPPYLGLPGENRAASVHMLLGSKMPGKLEVVRFRLAGMSLGGDKPSKEEGPWGLMLPRGASQLALFRDTQGRPQTRGVGSFATRDRPAATAQGITEWGSEQVPSSAESGW